MKLILFKIKHRWLNSILYLIVLILFGLLLTEGDSIDPFYALFWFILITEPYQYGLFDLTGHFSKTAGFTPFKMNASKLKQNLKLLSVKPLEFSKTNVIYTLFKLAPLWILILVFNPNMFGIPIIAFTIVMLLKSFVGPIHGIYSTRLREIFLEQPELKNKEKRKLFLDTIDEVNPYLDKSIFKRLYSFLTWGILGIIFWFYAFIFGSVLMDPPVNMYHPVWLVIVTIALVIVLSYSTYIIRAERRLENELYQS